MEGEVSQSSEAPSAPSAPQVSEQPVQTETHEVAPQAEPQAQESNEGRPAGFDPVEFSAEQKTRFDRVYGNMKRYETERNEQRELNARLASQLNELVTGQQQIVSHIQTADFIDAESRLNNQRDEAWNKGDVKSWNEANDRINEIKIRKALSERERQQPQPQQQQQPRNIDGRAIVNGAMERGSLDQTSAAVVNSWMGETNPDGNFKRSWVNANDPRNFEASKVAEAVLNSPLFVDKPMMEKLKEIDKRMGMTMPQPSGQNVLPPGNLTRGKPSSNIKLDPKIEQIAVRMKFAGADPKLTSQDHINAWKKATVKHGGQR